MTGCAAKTAPLAADADGCVVIVNLLGAPALTVIVDETAAVRLGDVKRNVCAPSPEMFKPTKVATPLAFVVAVVVPASTPVPDAIAAVTTTFAWLTGLSLASRNCTTGCGTNAAPVVIVAGGCVVIASFVATIPTTLIGDEMTDARFGDVNTMVCVPFPVMFRPENVAAPLPFVVAVTVPASNPPPVAIAAVTTTPA